MIFPDAVARVLLPYISAQGSEASLPRDLALSLWAGIGAFVQSARAHSRPFQAIPGHPGRFRSVSRRAGRLPVKENKRSNVGELAEQHLLVHMVNGA